MDDGVIWRIVYDHLAEHILEGAQHPEGRFHHDAQPAFYASPSPESAAHAVAAFCRPEDPPRCLVPLKMQDARLLDLRDPGVCDRLGISVESPSIPWQPQRAAGLRAQSWSASDAVRASGADGMIYAARSTPERWHLVLFRWNEPGTARVIPQLQDRRLFTPIATTA